MPPSRKSASSRRRRARAVSRAAAVRFVRGWGVRPSRPTAIDLGLVTGRASARVVGGLATFGES